MSKTKAAAPAVLLRDRMLVSQRAIAAYLGVSVEAVKAARQGDDPLPVFAHFAAACAIPADLIAWSERVTEEGAGSVLVQTSDGVKVRKCGDRVTFDNPRRVAITAHHVALLGQARKGTGPFRKRA